MSSLGNPQASIETTSSSEPPDATRPHNVSPPSTRSDIWFDEGNIILQVSTKQYKVHRSLLAMPSPVFDDMLGVPQPVDQESVEGCHIITLFDAVEDWDEFLPMLYHQRSIFQLRKNAIKSYAIPIKLMLAMLVLGHKYDFRAFWDQALQFLKICFPENLDALESFWFGDANDDGFAQKQILPHAYRIVHIALQLGIQTILPSAYYICMILRSTGSLLAGLDEPSGPTYLSYEKRHNLVLAREWIQETMTNIVYIWTDIRPDCATGHECERKFIDWYNNLVALAKFWDFVSLQPHSNIASADLCEICHGSFNNYAKKVRQAMFARFPSEQCNLPEWAALKDGT